MDRRPAFEGDADEEVQQLPKQPEEGAPEEQEEREPPKGREGLAHGLVD